MKIVSAAKDLQVVAMGHQGLAYVVHLFRLLRLASAHAEDDVAVDAADEAVPEVSLVADEARLLRMLQVVAVSFVDLAVNGLLDPDDLIDKPNNNVV